MKERDLYEPVREFIETEFDCFDTGIEKGSTYGKIDVVGLRNIVGDYGGHTEVISVEVKPQNCTYLKALGQAYAYSVMADRCYLAIHKPYDKDFSQEEKDQAVKLGVGLIKIGAHKTCSIVSSSPEQTPLQAHKLSLIDKLGYVQCVLCNTVFINEGIKSQNNSLLTEAITDNKAYKYWLHGLSKQRKEKRDNVYDKRHICPDCVQVFRGLQNNEFDV